MELTREHYSIGSLFLNTSIGEYRDLANQIRITLHAARNAASKTESENLHKYLYSAIANAVRYRYNRGGDLCTNAIVSAACNTTCLAINDLIHYGLELSEYLDERAERAKNSTEPMTAMDLRIPDRKEKVLKALDLLQEWKAKLKSNKSFDTLYNCADELIEIAFAWCETSLLKKGIYTLAEDIVTEIDKQIKLLEDVRDNLTAHLI